MKSKKLFIITVSAIPLFEELDSNDQEVFGEWGDSGEYTFELEATDREAALDDFHSSIPIKVLDDFNIECEEAE